MIFEEQISPRFNETDALGHINNTVVPQWFEKGREPIFKIFTPDMDVKKWRLIIAHIDVDFMAELNLGSDVTIKTYLTKLGNSSMTVTQEAWQDGKIAAKGNAALIHFDYTQRKPVAIGEVERAQLESLVNPGS